MTVNGEQPGKAQSMRFKLAGAGVGLFLIGLLVGYLVQTNRVRAADQARTTAVTELAATRIELETSRLQARIGAALAETERGNYERARQIMSSFYQAADTLLAQIADAGATRVIRQATTQRDEMITLLSRAAPESGQRLSLLYTQVFEVVDPFGKQSPSAMTPAPADTTATQ